jgi:hypothetical protein
MAVAAGKSTGSDRRPSPWQGDARVDRLPASPLPGGERPARDPDASRTQIPGMKKVHHGHRVPREMRSAMEREAALAEAERLEQERVQFELHAHRMRDYFYRPQPIDVRGWIDPQHK